jgi:hypothetical protein
MQPAPYQASRSIPERVNKGWIGAKSPLEGIRKEVVFCFRIGPRACYEPIDSSGLWLSPGQPGAIEAP